eukprot:TRINITY_DN4367_c0_g1_i1.p1 TRINITY_DN4367_c0_g1~~TRINITY_DN4367_c0_g1_i1.p1  ORF type:complete len:442 (+),score=108.45 TRINITY_DN4367_c0_g1_i1:185-1510(+)
MSSVLLRIEELKGGERQGIGSILGFSGQTNERRQSLRRTFSADMSSKKWSAENIPISLRKISSAEEFSTMSSPNTSSASSSSGDEEEKERVRKDLERPEQFDIWSAIQSQKTANTDSLPTTPYIHPLVKRSKSLLSEKSLQICTESLGSETGSDGFSSSDYFPSDSSDDDEEEESEEEEVRDEMQGTKKELVQVNYNCSISRRSPTRSFPPPLPSLSSPDGACLRMRPHREGGRLIVAAIPIVSQKFLHAEREGGRLRLSLISPPVEKVAFVPPQQEPEIQFMEVEEEEEEVEQVEEEEEEEEKEIVIVKNRGLVMEVEVVKKEEEVMRVGQPILMMNNKIMGGMHTMHLNNPDPWMGKKFSDQDGPRRVSPLLAAASFNGYDLCWKTGHMAHSAKMPITNKLMVSKKPLLFKGEDLFYVKRCKEYRRPVVVGKPFCIATT